MLVTRRTGFLHGWNTWLACAGIVAVLILFAPLRLLAIAAFMTIAATATAPATTALATFTTRAFRTLTGLALF